MKRFLLFALTLIASAGMVIAAPVPKVKTIKVADNAVYEGLALKNDPLGNGTLNLSSCGTLSGVFNGLDVSNGKLIIAKHKCTITGDFSMQIYKENKYSANDLAGTPALIKMVQQNLKYKYLEITIKNGKFNNRPIQADAKMYYENGAYTLELIIPYSLQLSPEIKGKLEKFAADTKYKGSSNGKILLTINNQDAQQKVVEKATKATYKFSNGAVAQVDLNANIISLTRSNGDNIGAVGSGFEVKKYRITAGKSIIENGKVTHIFENGNKYIGTVKGENILPYTKVTSFDELLSFTGLTWAWADFKKHADNGTLIYADGKSDNVIAGITETERKAWEAEIKVLRANDKFVADGDRYVASCTITYRDGVVFHYSYADGLCEYVYKNGDKLKISKGTLTKDSYNDMLATLIAPDLYSWDVEGERVFDNGNVSIRIASEGRLESVKFAKDSKGNFVEYSCWSSTRVLEGADISKCKHTFTNHSKYKSIDKDYTSTVVLKNGNKFCGEIWVKYDENAKCSLNDNAYIKKFGITIKAAPATISEISFSEGELYNSSGTLIAVYANGKVNEEQLKNAKLKQKIDQLKAKHEDWGWYINSSSIYYAGDYPTIFILDWSRGTPIELIKAIWGSQSLRLVWTKTVGGVKEEKYRFYVGNGDYDTFLYFSNGRLKN